MSTTSINIGNAKNVPISLVKPASEMIKNTIAIKLNTIAAIAVAFFFLYFSGDALNDEIDAAFNAIATAPLMLLNMEYADQQILGPAPIGIVAMVPMIVLAVLISFKTTKSK